MEGEEETTSSTEPGASPTPVQTKPPERVQPKFVGSATGQPIDGSSSDEPTEDTDGGAKTDEEGKQVVGHGGKPMSSEAISDRVARERKKFLREYFGTEDEEEAAKRAAKLKQPGKHMSPDDLKEFERLKRIEQARQRTRQTQEQRTKTDIETRDARIKELETEIHTMRTDAAVSEQDQKIADAASEYVDPKFMRYAKRDLAEHLIDLKNDKPEQFKKFGEASLKRWFEKYAKENPQFAKQAEASTGDPSPPAATTPAPSSSTVPKRVVVKSPAPKAPPKPAPKDTASTVGGKTIAPGPNSMSKTELRAHLKSQGRRLPW